MFFKFWKNAALCAVLLLSAVEFSASANAQSGNKELGKQLYGRFDAGAAIINDVTYSTSAATSGITVTADVDLVLDTGTAVSGAIGYRLNENVAIEGEFGYTQADFESVTGTATATSGGSSYTISQSASLTGNASVLSGMANVVLSPGGDTGGFRPFVGGGFGMSQVSTEITGIGTLTVTGASEEYTKMIGNAFVGFDYKVDEDVTLGAKYRYLWIESVDTGWDDVTGHVLQATLTINF